MSYAYNERDHDLTPYERLAVAIVRQAVEDYYDFKRRRDEYRYGSAGWERMRCEMYLLEQWFAGRWCGLLTFDNGEEIFRLVKKGEIQT